MKKTFFIDFDGTITKVDSCAAMVEAFAREGWQEINRMWEEKELSTVECANRTFELFQTSPDELKDFLTKIEIDEYFPAFLEVCREKAYKVYILSDGYDLNLKTILEKHHLTVPYYCNQLIHADGFQIKCPYINESCGSCGTCKTTLMDKLQETDSQSIYIGDGYSDICPAAKADIVFAKGTLIKLCQEKGIPAFPYQNFQDIIPKI